MARDREPLLDFARGYTEAWNSNQPARVAEHYGRGATIAINGASPLPMIEFAESFMSAFPDMELEMDDIVISEDERVEYHWTSGGTNTGPGGTGHRVRISGFEEWTIGADGLIAASLGNYDEAEYERQLEHGVDETG